MYGFIIFLMYYLIKLFLFLTILKISIIILFNGYTSISCRFKQLLFIKTWFKVILPHSMWNLSLKKFLLEK